MTRLLPTTNAVRWASGHFLTNELPMDYINMNDKQVLEYIAFHVCEQYENDLPEVVWDMIEWLAEDAVNNIDRLTATIQEHDMMQAILIDTPKQTIEIVDYSGDYKDIYGLLGCELFTSVYLEGVGQDTLYVDDEGLYVENQVFFNIKGCPQPLAGRGLILGTDDEGESIDCMSSLEQIKDMVTWRDASLPAPEAGFFAMPLTDYDMMEAFMSDDTDTLTDEELLYALGVK